jgi:hypothetical protein
MDWPIRSTGTPAARTVTPKGAYLDFRFASGGDDQQTITYVYGRLTDRDSRRSHSAPA